MVSEGQASPRLTALGTGSYEILSRPTVSEWLLRRTAGRVATVIADPVGALGGRVSTAVTLDETAQRVAVHPSLELSRRPASVLSDALSVHDFVAVSWSFDGAADSLRPGEVVAMLGLAGTLLELDAVEGALCATIGRKGEAAAVDLSDLNERLAVQLSESARKARLELDEVSQALDRLHALRRREQIESANRVNQIHDAHSRQIEALRGTARFRLGDALVNAAYDPRSVVALPRVLRDVYRSRRDGPGTAVAPDSSNPTPRRRLVVLSKLDDHGRRVLEPEAAIIGLDEASWEDQLAQQPALLLVDSIDRGGAEPGSATGIADPRLAAVLDACRSRGIPTALWSRESPVEIETLVPIARAFDHVLVADDAFVGRVARELGHDRVAFLAGAAQPMIHNPIGARDNVVARAGFAGSWLGPSAQQRLDEVALLLDRVAAAGLVDIFDLSAQRSDTDVPTFPGRFRSAIVGAPGYTELLDLYKRYAVFLHSQSADRWDDSPLRRICEILAGATPVIAAPSDQVEEAFGDLVITTETAGQTFEAVEALVSDPVRRDQLGQRGHRHVMKHHTYSHRFADIAEMVGLGSPGIPDPLVSVICASHRPEMLDRVVANVSAQTFGNREFVFVLNSSHFDRAEVDAKLARVPRVRVIEVDESATLADCLNSALELAQGEYFAKFDDDDLYGADYLTDLMFAFEYAADAGVVGKHTYFAYMQGRDETVLRMPGEEFSYVTRVAGGTIVADRRRCSDVRFPPVRSGTDTLFFEDLGRAGVKVFSADRFNFVQTRMSDLRLHTWQIPERQFLANTERVGRGLARDVVFC